MHLSPPQPPRTPGGHRRAPLRLPPAPAASPVPKLQVGLAKKVEECVEFAPEEGKVVVRAAPRGSSNGTHGVELRVALQALEFVETGPELGSNYSEVIAPQDVAVYGALCALPSLDRSDLKSKVIDNINFRNFLELVPEVRELVNDFYSSRYGSCLEHLEKLKPNLLLDIHLHEHVQTLYMDIRHKAIIQYTLPFISVDLNTMATAFKTSVSMLEKELAALITENKIQARIDSHNKIASLVPT